MELQRRAQEEEMLERIKRRVAGEKVEVPQVLQRLRSMITPRTAAAAAAAAAAAEGDALLQSTPGSRRGSSRWPLPPAAATLAASSGQQHAAAGMAAVPEASMAEGDQALEVQGDPWWPKVQRAAEQLTTHPDFQLAVMLVILLNCIGALVAWLVTSWHACMPGTTWYAPAAPRPPTHEACHACMCSQCSTSWPCLLLQRWRSTALRCHWTPAGMRG